MKNMSLELIYHLKQLLSTLYSMPKFTKRGVKYRSDVGIITEKNAWIGRQHIELTYNVYPESCKKYLSWNIGLLPKPRPCLSAEYDKKLLTSKIHNPPEAVIPFFISSEILDMAEKAKLGSAMVPLKDTIMYNNIGYQIKGISKVGSKITIKFDNFDTSVIVPVIIDDKFYYAWHTLWDSCPLEMTIITDDEFRKYISDFCKKIESIHIFSHECKSIKISRIDIAKMRGWLYNPDNKEWSFLKWNDDGSTELISHRCENVSW